MQPIKRNNRVNQNNADLLLSVYELTARSSLQMAQRPRHQSHGRQQQYAEQCTSPETMVSPKKINAAQTITSPQMVKPPHLHFHQHQSLAAGRRTAQRPPQLILRQQQGVSHNIVSPRYLNLLSNGAPMDTLNKNSITIIKSYVKSASDIIEGTSDNHERLLRSYRFAKQNLEAFVGRLVHMIIIYIHHQENNEVQISMDSHQSQLCQQVEKFKIENESLKRRIQEFNFEENKIKSLNTTAPIQNQVLNQTLLKMEKKAESRKICIKKLYQLLEKNERELELYRTGKKRSNKTSFIQQSDFASKTQSLASKKNELHEILNTVYTRKNKGDSLESILFNFVASVDPKAYEQIKSKNLLTNSSQMSYENSMVDDNNQDKLALIQGCLKSIKNDIIDKKDAELALHNSLQYTLRLIEANQQIWRQAIDKGTIDCMTFEPFIQFMDKQGYDQMVIDLQDLEQKQNDMQEEILSWLQDKHNNDDNTTQYSRLTTKLNQVLVDYSMESTGDVMQAIDTINQFIATSLGAYDNKMESSRKINEQYETKVAHLEKLNLDQEHQAAQERIAVIHDHEQSQQILKQQFMSLKSTYEDKLSKTNELIFVAERKSKQEVSELKSSIYQNVFQLEQKVEQQNVIIVKHEEKSLNLTKKHQEQFEEESKNSIQFQGQVSSLKIQLQDEISQRNEQVTSLEQILQEMFNDNSTLQQKLQTEEHKNLYLRSVWEDKYLKFQQCDEKNQKELEKQVKSSFSQLVLKLDNLKQKFQHELQITGTALKKKIEQCKEQQIQIDVQSKCLTNKADEYSTIQEELCQLKREFQIAIDLFRTFQQYKNEQYQETLSRQTRDNKIKAQSQSKKLKELENSLADKNGIITILQGDKQKFSTTIMNMQNQSQIVQNQIERQQNTYQICQSNLDQLIEDNQQQSTQNTQLEIKCNEYTQINSQLQIKLEEAISTKIRTNNDLQTNKNQFERQIQILTKQTQDFQGQIEMYQQDRVTANEMIQKQAHDNEHNNTMFKQQLQAQKLSLESTYAGLIKSHDKSCSNMQEKHNQEIQSLTLEYQQIIENMNLNKLELQKLQSESQNQLQNSIKSAEQLIQHLINELETPNDRPIQLAQVLDYHSFENRQKLCSNQDQNLTQVIIQFEELMHLQQILTEKLNKCIYSLQVDLKSSNIQKGQYIKENEINSHLVEELKIKIEYLDKIYIDSKLQCLNIREQCQLEQDNNKDIFQQNYQALEEKSKMEYEMLNESVLILQSNSRSELEITKQQFNENYIAQKQDFSDKNQKLAIEYKLLNDSYLALQTQYEIHTQECKYNIQQLNDNLVTQQQIYVEAQEVRQRENQQSILECNILNTTYIQMQKDYLRCQLEKNDISDSSLILKNEYSMLKQELELKCKHSNEESISLMQQISKIEEEKINLNQMLLSTQNMISNLKEQSILEFTKMEGKYLCSLDAINQAKFAAQQEYGGLQQIYQDLQNTHQNYKENQMEQITEIQEEKANQKHIQMALTLEFSNFKDQSILDFTNLEAKYQILQEVQSQSEQQNQQKQDDMNETYLALQTTCSNNSQKSEFEFNTLNSKYHQSIEEIQKLKERLDKQQSHDMNQEKISSDNIEQLKQNASDFAQLLEELNKSTQEQSQATAFCHSLENLLQELLFSRVNLTSIKQCLTDSQRDKLTDFRKKVGEIQTKMLSSEKQQKVIDDCKFNLVQYQQIVDKSEMRARHFENECLKKDEQLKEFQTMGPMIERKQNTLESYQEENLISQNEENDSLSYDLFLDFSLRDEVLYGDKSFFQDLSIILFKDKQIHVSQQIYFQYDTLIVDSLIINHEDISVQQL